MAFSCCSPYDLSAVTLTPVSAVSYRSKNCVSGKFSDFAPFVNKSARRRTSAPRLFGAVGVGPEFGSSNNAETLKTRRQKEGTGKLFRLSVSSSSSPPSVSYTEEVTDEVSLDHGDGGDGFNGGGGGHGGGGGGGGDGSGGLDSTGPTPGGSADGGGLLGSFIRGWDARVRADPQFAFKVLMEEVVGVGMCDLGDMATRPNFGLNELDLVFSTLVVGSILNFTLMYMLAPTAVAGALSSKLPGIFASSPAGHMFEPGAYSLLERFGTFVYKGTQFAGVGLFAGLVGTGISSALINARKKMDPNFVSQNATPPILLNSATWAAHMGLSSNFRYQTLNGLEFALAKALSPGIFKISVPVLRGLNNVLGGMSFVALARLTGSQPSDTSVPPESPQSEETTPLEPANASV
ncbi:unnamed protein product [Calypogeia fissa]